MADRPNPMKLNPLQAKTLTLLQELARSPNHATPAEEPGAIIIRNLPQPHGDHFHLGPYVVLARDATGLQNPSAWVALERKGLIRSMFPMACVLTANGMGYATGIADQILHGSDH